METWKGVVIVGMFGALLAYGYQQNQVLTPPPTPDPAVHGTPEPPPPIRDWVGKTPPAWDIAPGFWTNTPKPISQNDLKGHAALLEFWRIGCSHCEQAAPFMRGIDAEYRPKGLQIIGFQSPNWKTPAEPENKWPLVQLKAKEWNIQYPIALDKSSELFRKYKGRKWPSFVVLGKDGKVVYAEHGHTPEHAKALIDAINKVLGIKAPEPLKK